MSLSVFQSNDYRGYLLQMIAEKDGHGRGFRSQLAEKMGVQRTFVSQVLSGDSHFNMEHADLVSEILGHTAEEADFFLLLVLYARASTPRLKARLTSQIQKIRDARQVLKNRFQEKDSLSLEDKVEYYSSWLYGAVRVLLTIPGFQTRDILAERLKVPTDQLGLVLEFLLSRGLIEEIDGVLQTSAKHLFLGNDIKLIAKHHTNWRMQAIRSLDHEKKTDLHFSAVNSLSEKDVTAIREVLTETLGRIRAQIKESPEEVLYALGVDFFEV